MIMILKCPSLFVKFIVTAIDCVHFLYCYTFYQINPYVVRNKSAFMGLHVMRLQKFYVKLMLFHHQKHSNGLSTIQLKHLKCRKMITEYIHHKHQHYPIHQ